MYHNERIRVYRKGHAFGVRVDGTSSRRFLSFLSLTAFQAEGCGGGFAIGHTLSGVRVQRVQKVQRVLRVADCRSAAMLIKSALRDLLSVSYDMLPTRQGSGDSHQRGKTPKWYLKYMTRCFFPSYLSFPLEVAKSFIMPPSAVTSTSSIIIRITTVHTDFAGWRFTGFAGRGAPL